MGCEAPDEDAKRGGNTHSYEDQYPARAEMKNNGWVIPGRVTPSMSQRLEPDIRERNGLGATGIPGRDDEDFNRIAQARERQLRRQKN